MKKVLGQFSFALLLLPSLGRSQQPAPSDSVPTIRQTVQEVVVEVVARDARGRVVRNLKPEDLEIYENGVRQQIRSFKLVSGRDVVIKSPTKANEITHVAPAPNPVKAVNLVCIVFANLDPYTKKYAVDAAREFLKSQFDPDTWVGVFNLDSKLNVIQPFTTNRNEVLAAADKASTTSTVDFAQVATAVLNAAPNMVTMQSSVSGQLGHGGSVSADETITGGELNTQTIVSAEASNSEAANRQRGDLAGQRRQFGAIEGMREMDQIDAMVKKLATLPGRKSVLLMSPGLATTGDADMFKAMVDRANKMNVTIYGIDVNGLRADVDQAQASSQALQHAAKLSSTQGGRFTSGAQSAEQMRQDDYVNDAVRTTDTQSALRALSEQTGGFLIGSTNDLRKPFQRLLEDVDTHYEVIYTPSSLTWDGRFRAIEVKTERANLSLQSRPGYFALPVLGESSELTPSEFIGLAALSVPKAPHYFDFKAAAYQFRPGSANSRNGLVFEIPVRSLQATAEPGLNRRRIHVAVLALVKDANGEVVDKFNQDSSYEIPEENLAKAQVTTLTFEHPVALPPGHYTVDAAVLDGEKTWASTSQTSFDSPEPKGVGLSSILLLERTEPVSGKIDPADPFEYLPNPNQAQRVIPALTTDLRADAHPSVFFVVYPDPSLAEKPKIQAEFLLDGKVLGKQVADLPAPDATGAIPMSISAVAKTGKCELRITAIQGSSSKTQSLQYSVGSK